ncbi:MAG: hypothetical protein C4315_08735 [Chloroflexota bacterium]
MITYITDVLIRSISSLLFLSPFMGAELARSIGGGFATLSLFISAVGVLFLGLWTATAAVGI